MDPTASPLLSNGLQPLSCLRCARHKVRYDRLNPCSRCNRLGAVCEFPIPKTERRRRRNTAKTSTTSSPGPSTTPSSSALNEKLFARLEVYEEKLRSLGVDVEAINGSQRQPTTPISVSSAQLDAQSQGCPCPYAEKTTMMTTTTLDKAAAVIPIDPTIESGAAGGEHAVNNSSGLALGILPRTTAAHIDYLYPPPQHFTKLWSIYLRNVHPITMILHPTSTGAMLAEAAQCPGHASESATVLLFAVLVAAIMSMTEEECDQAFAMKQSILCSRYRSCCELALVRVEFIMSCNLTVLQAYMVYLSSLISRPTLHTFHKVISSSEAFTIGTSPWDQSCKLRRKAAALSLNPSAVHRYTPAISREINDALQEILVDTHQGKQAIQPKLYLKKFVLNVSLTCSFGTRIYTVRDALLKEIVGVEEALTRYRSHTNNLQDYLPFLRWIPSAQTAAKAYSERRDIYMNSLMDQLKSDIANGIDTPCSVGQVIKDVNFDFNNKESMSLSITLLSAGLDTIPANLSQGVAVLSSKQGQEIQEDIRAEILAHYSSFEEAWERMVAEEAVPGLQSLVQEILRYFSVVPMGFPRTNIMPVVMDNGISIPANTWFYMNSKSANFDPLAFPEPDQFIPRRFVDKEGSEPLARRTGGPPMRHFGYGAGTRACVGYHLANRLMYGILGRLILGWKIQAPGPVDIHPDTYNACPSSLVAEPKDFL
ncbi:Pc21g22560 [Penicillium rubens Wisconsin 54-1255]|uniref:Pc21g22560 protein n=1 Tax=Penicillium rubens (strain ATCC 28089 / DSM 1075 / NRRL 1951 / Wisconsin 54-1255) TaxID=500485 RepID=B6HNG4_PENRW|nr:Pc21g22560 [Penicillium rubens Wisconsin 54-1255]